jgi:hypothetical protein
LKVFWRKISSVALLLRNQFQALTYDFLLIKTLYHPK